MKRTFALFAILVLSLGLFPQARSNEIYTIGWATRSSGRFTLNQNLRIADSPTFVGLTLSGLTASTVVYSNASKVITSLANGAGFLLNDGSGGLSFAASIIPAGTVPLTGNWLGNAFQVSFFPPILALTDGATQAISAAQCQSYLIHNGSCTQAIEIDLPAAAVGMRITIYVCAAFTIKIDPNLTDQIMVLTSTAGDYLLSDAVRGTIISLVCLQANKWEPLGLIGAWTEE